MNEVANPTSLRAEELTGDLLANEADRALAAEDLERALVLFDRAEPAVGDPDRCAGGRWMAHMLRGNFAAAWRESDAIRQRGAPDPHRFWNGESLRDRRVILRCLHGFGDAVQMFRFLPRLQEQVRSLVVEVPPHLVPLAPCFNGMGEVITWGQDAPQALPKWDVQTEIMELPYLLRVEGDDLAPTSGYLQLPAEVQDHAVAATGRSSRRRVGLAWGAGEWNPSRSIPFDVFRSLLEVPDVEFWSLQGGRHRADWDLTGVSDRYRDVFEVGEGLVPLAALIERLDLVITVDTLAAHLAGVAGIPCWLLLQNKADWRWMTGRADTPWYPSLRLWRQRADESWAGLMERVQCVLRVGNPGHLAEGFGG